MTYRDEHGHFISREEAGRRGLIPTEEDEGGGVDEEQETGYVPPERWGSEAQRPDQPEQPVYVDVGRGQAVGVQAGALFSETIEQLAEQAHYGGYFRVFLNGSEILNPEEAPETIEPGMRIAITSYDKVG